MSEEKRTNMRLTKETKKALDLLKVELELGSYEELMKYFIQLSRGSRG